MLGPNHLDNYAWACPFCNAAKSDAVDHRLGRRRVRLFHPRRDLWPDHFVFFHDYLFVTGFTAVGRATEAALRFNDARLAGPLGTRHEHIVAGRHPPTWARDWLASGRRGAQPPARPTRRDLL